MGERTKVLRDVPPSDKAATEKDFEIEGATSINSVKQTDGKWTITATFPSIDEPGN